MNELKTKGFYTKSDGTKSVSAQGTSGGKTANEKAKPEKRGHAAAKTAKQNTSTIKGGAAAAKKTKKTAPQEASDEEELDVEQDGSSEEMSK